MAKKAPSINKEVCFFALNSYGAPPKAESKEEFILFNSVQSDVFLDS